MRVVNDRKDDSKYRVDLAAVRKAFKANRKRTGKLLEQEIVAQDRAIKFLKTIVNTQLRDGRALDLNDELVSGTLGCTPREARRTREFLSKIGVLFVPDYGRHKGQGTYPIWLLSMAFTKITVVEADGSKRTRRPDSELYNAEYLAIRDRVVSELREQFEWEEQEFGKPVVVGSGFFWATVNQLISQELRELGKQRADYRL